MYVNTFLYLCSVEIRLLTKPYRSTVKRVYMKKNRKVYRLHTNLFDEFVEFPCLVRSDAISFAVACYSQAECDYANLYVRDSDGDFLHVFGIGG